MWIEQHHPPPPKTQTNYARGQRREAEIGARGGLRALGDGHRRLDRLLRPDLSFCVWCVFVKALDGVGVLGRSTQQAVHHGPTAPTGRNGQVNGPR